MLVSIYGTNIFFNVYDDWELYNTIVRNEFYYD